MSFRSWMYVFAIIGVIAAGFAANYHWDLFLSYQEQHASERKNASEYYAETSNQSVASCGAVMDESGFFDWLTCLAENVSTDGSIKQAEYDLKAQQDMAEWAFGMLIVTVWLALFTLLGVFFVWRTLKATQETVSATKEIGRDQTRAYIHMKTIRHKDQVLGIDWKFFVENSGQAPARWFEIGAIADLVEGDFPPQPRDDQLNFNRWNALPGKEVFSVRTHPTYLCDENLARQRDEIVPLWVAGTIRYETFFGETFRTEFSFFSRSAPGATSDDDWGYRMSRNTGALKVFESVDNG